MTPLKRALRLVGSGSHVSTREVEKEIVRALRRERLAIIKELGRQGRLMDDLLGNDKHWPLLNDIAGIILRRNKHDN